MSQPVELYPNGYPVTRSQPMIDSSHTNNSNGSFAHVFIVLAVIAAISVASCVLGRFLSRRHHRVRAENHHTRAVADKQQINHGLGPREWESRHNKLPSFTNNMRDRTPDIEFGFDKKTTSGNKVNDDKENGVLKPPPYDHHHHRDHSRDNNHHHQNDHFNGKFKPQVRFADDRGNNEEEMSRPVDRRSFNDKFKPQVRFA